MELSARIDLASEPNFHIGSIAVRPALLELDAGGTQHRIPPKVMQVFVALATAGGRVVTREELAERCWDGRIVGEDALNRIIAKLRSLASGVGEDSFEIETITRVGYRLRTSEQPASRERPAARNGSRHVLPALVVVACTLGAAALYLTRMAPPASRADPPLVAAAADLETRGLSAVFEGAPERTAVGIGYLRQAVALTPNRAQVWGSLAMAYVLSLPDTPPSQRSIVVARTREAAARAQALDPREGRSLAAIVSLDPTFRHWAAKDAKLRSFMARDRSRAAPLLFQRVQFLTSVGRTREALSLINELNQSSPLLPWIQAARVDLLAANGRIDEAERVAAWAGSVWPRNRLVWFTRFYLAAFEGHPDQALALAASGRPDQTSEQEMILAIATAKALQSDRSRDIDTLLTQFREPRHQQQGYLELGIRAAVALHRNGDALSFARKLYGSDLAAGSPSTVMPKIGLSGPSERNTALLFVPPVNAAVSDPDFVSLTEKLGLAAFSPRSDGRLRTFHKE